MKILLIYESVQSQKDGAIVEPLALFQQNLTRKQRKNRELPYQSDSISHTSRLKHFLEENHEHYIL